MSGNTVSAPSKLVSWQVILLLMAYAALAHFNRVGISVAGSEVFIRELGITETRMGWVYSSFLIVYTLGMLPGGLLIDRIGAVRSLTLLGLSMGVFVMLTGSLGWLGESPHGLWIGLLIIRGLAGLCSAPLHPGAAYVIADVTPLSQRATGNGLVTAGAVVGIALCYPVFGWLMDRLTWPWAFVASGILLSGFGWLWKILATSRVVPQHESADAAAATQAREAERAAAAAESWKLLRRRHLWLLTLSYAAFGYFQYLFFYWMNYYFQNVLHVPDVQARQAAFWIALAQAAGMAVGGVVSDIVCRLLGSSLGRRSIVMTGMGAGAFFGLVAVTLPEYERVAGCLAASMAALGLCEGVFWTTATDIGGRARGFAAAFMNTGGNIGGLISPVLTPAMAQYLGWPGAIAVACFVSGGGAIVWCWIRTERKTQIVE